MNSDQPVTGLKKRQQISDTRKQVFIMVAFASAAIVICIVLGIKIINAIIYQAKVNGELSKTADVMAKNVKNVKPVINNINSLKSNKALNLPNLLSDDSTVFQVVIDSLPTEDDRVALSTSLQSKILNTTGATIQQIAVDSVSADGTEATTSTDSSTESNTNDKTPHFPTAQQINFKVTLVGTFDSMREVLLSIEKTIRPITISKIAIDGTDDKLTMTLDASTYYSPSVDFKLGTKEVPYEEK